MFSCCQSRKSRHGETQPLLPQHDANTNLQRELQDKLHHYEMVRAMYSGFMPSSTQIVSHLRALLVSDLLNPNNLTLSSAGRQLARDCRAWIRVFIEFLRQKNGEDQLQEAIWNFSRSTASVDTSDLAQRVSFAKARADSTAAYESLRTITGLLMTNADFRLLVGDLTTVSRQIFADTAASVSAAAAEVSQQVEPSEPQKDAIGGDSSNEEPPTTEDVAEEAERVADITIQGVNQASRDAVDSTMSNFSGKQRKAILHRIKQTVDNLRKREDYSNSANTISQIIQHYLMIYYRLMGSTVTDLGEDIEVNKELNQAIRSLWAFLSSFGEREDWEILEQNFSKLLKNYQGDEEYQELFNNIGSTLFSLLTDPDFYNSAEESIDSLKEKLKVASTDSNQELANFFDQLKQTLLSVSQDKIVVKIIAASKVLMTHLVAAFRDDRSRLPADILHIFLPILIRAVQHIPIPRLEVSVPEMDLLLENVILEPGHTIHASSFLPYRLLFTATNNFELRKTHSKETTSAMTNIINITLNGLNISAQEFGYWVRVHSPPYLPYFGDEGIASFALDKRGIDISLEIAIGKQRLEQVFSLRAVRVCIHKLDYTIKKSSWSYLWWIVKPFVKHMVRRTLEKQIAEQIVAAAHVINRELVFVRERLRAARIADPDNFLTFVKAVITRMTPTQEPDVYTRVGVDAPRQGVFENVYTPASLMKIWHEEGERADELVDGGDESGVRLTWRNRIFDYLSSRRPSQQPLRTV
ncbi:hypothetical protein LOZ39_001884 [Ophidiomyces ophidiicola]|nr:hypothetical protein LOZ49_000795 [Ophidiomyces ophidiicola]KAI2057791.1 hypothetical protein LOZ44_001274 [Ophidiomyces ophidiicola]KAI2077887.1 hypothetical protein LOZ39_001884 [Ophidiomyces ophidiicola]KAI2141415.1 hypothetical protein LOZ28_002490 [Ophidiomyces ophidiicola]KAI2146410.1 hypothetical protein LOZ29_000167 [Ophidiomyces ophidiicola]